MRMVVNQTNDNPSAHRSRFHQDLAALEQDTQAMADLARGALEDAVGALATSDTEAWDAVIAGDDRIDDAYLDIERRAIDLVVREQPVASDLRLLAGLSRAALHLERIGDLGAAVAHLGQSVVGQPAKPDVVETLQAMGAAAALLTDRAVVAFVQRDTALCEELAARAGDVSDMGRDLLSHVLSAPDPEGLAWAVTMLRVSGHIERAA